eukprot:TRINITY_DN15564_c0_g1_i1.p1 TRINITY_DN15564_c0_g1~~TRINITY_DN15564_c0_g1_i1.p1  ORF type:complete len:180 (-),score=45.09 TRINITY_DN15564_c0_g1_i1:25-564(-)
MSNVASEDALLDTLARSNEVSPTDKMLYIVNGVIVSLCPIYIYTSIFHLSFKELWYVFLLVAIVCGGLLSKAYETVAISTFNAISRTRGLLAADLDVLTDSSSNKNQKQKQAKAALVAERRDLTHQEALSFSVLYNNAMFLALVVLFAFYLFKAVPGTFNFILSNGLAAAVVMLSSSSK